MAGNTVSLVFAGDSKSLEKTFSNVGAGAKQMAGQLDAAEGKSRSFGGAMDHVGESVGNSESKFMGTADLLDGLGGAFGLPTAGATQLFRGFADLSGGFEVVSGLVKSGIGQLGEFATSIGLTSAATSVWTGIQAAFNAVMALNPVVLITLAIAGLVAALILAYQHSETFRNIVQGAFNDVKAAAEAVWHFIEALPGQLMGVATAIKDAILWPYKTAFNLIAHLWNDTVGSLSFHVPDWVPGLGGKGFSMPQLPTFHTGGVVGQGITPGTPMPIMALAGETVSPLAGAGGGGVTVVVQGHVLDGRQLADLVQQALLRKQKVTPLGFAT